MPMPPGKRRQTGADGSGPRRVLHSHGGRRDASGKVEEPVRLATETSVKRRIAETEAVGGSMVTDGTTSGNSVPPADLGDSILTALSGKTRQDDGGQGELPPGLLIRAFKTGFGEHAQGTATTEKGSSPPTALGTQPGDACRLLWHRMLRRRSSSIADTSAKTWHLRKQEPPTARRTLYVARRERRCRTRSRPKRRTHRWVRWGPMPRRRSYRAEHRMLPEKRGSRFARITDTSAKKPHLRGRKPDLAGVQRPSRRAEAPRLRLREPLATRHAPAVAVNPGRITGIAGPPSGLPLHRFGAGPADRFTCPSTGEKVAPLPSAFAAAARRYDCTGVRYRRGDLLLRGGRRC